jgi:hypothetical protein
MSVKLIRCTGKMNIPPIHNQRLKSIFSGWVKFGHYFLILTKFDPKPHVHVNINMPLRKERALWKACR